MKDEAMNEQKAVPIPEDLRDWFIEKLIASVRGTYGPSLLAIPDGKSFYTAYSERQMREQETSPLYWTYWKGVQNFPVNLTVSGLMQILMEWKDNRIAALEAENAALKSTIASLLSIDDSKVSEYVVLDAEALKAAAGNRVAELEAKVAALQWSRITPENLPEKGIHEVGRFTSVGGVVADDWNEVSAWTRSLDGATILFRDGWTHFRPINPPA